MIDIEYTKACTEVLEILNYIPKADYDKIPNDIIDVLETDKNKEYKFKYNVNKTLTEQNVSEQTKIMIALFYREYWATDYQRKVILENQKIFMAELEEEKIKKYNPDNLFKDNIRKQDVIKREVSNQDMQMIEYKQDSFFVSIINRIKAFFGYFKNKHK